MQGYLRFLGVIGGFVVFAFLGYTIDFIYIYENEMIWGNCQSDCTSTTRKTERIYISRGFHKAFNKGGIQFLVKSSCIVCEGWYEFAL